jgi:hypothetical protein
MQVDPYINISNFFPLKCCINLICTLNSFIHSVGVNPYQGCTIYMRNRTKLTAGKTKLNALWRTQYDEKKQIAVFYYRSTSVLQSKVHSLISGGSGHFAPIATVCWRHTFNAVLSKATVSQQTLHPRTALLVSPYEIQAPNNTWWRANKFHLINSFMSLYHH